jgi:hypothetical protein
MSNYYSKLVGRIVRDVEFIDDETVRISFGNTMTEPPVDMTIDNTATIRPRDKQTTKTNLIWGDGSWQKRLDAGQCPRCNSSALTFVASPDGAKHKCKVCDLLVG